MSVHILDEILPIQGNASSGWVVRCSCGWIEFGGCQTDAADKFDDHHKTAAMMVEQSPREHEHLLAVGHLMRFTPRVDSVGDYWATECSCGWRMITSSATMAHNTHRDVLGLPASTPTATSQLPHTAPLAPASPAVRQKPNTAPAKVQHGRMAHSGPHIVMCQCGWKENTVSYRDGESKYRQHLVTKMVVHRVVHCDFCSKDHAIPDPPGSRCGWCGSTVATGTEHHPTRPYIPCAVTELGVVDYEPALYLHPAGHTPRTPGDILIPDPEPPSILGHSFSLHLPERQEGPPDLENPYLLCACGYSTPIRIIRHRVHSDTERRVVDVDGSVSAMEVGRVLVDVLKHLELNNKPEEKKEDQDG